MKTSIIKQTLLDTPTRHALFDLHARYFENHALDQFINDLAEKEWVILLQEGDDVVGFSTLTTLTRTENGRIIGFLFSGDTIVDDRHRCSCALSGAFCHMVERFRTDYDDFYWFLITKGHRTFRFLPTFFHQFYPGLGESEAAHLKPLLDHIAADKFGANYSSGTGLIIFPEARDKLRPVAANVPQAHATCPYVRLFLDVNPGYRNGDELACITSLARDNMKHTVQIIQRTRVEWVE